MLTSPNQRVSVRSWIARELVSNILVHREYSKGFPAKVVIESDRIYAENWSRTNRHGRITPDTFTPEPKNPLLARFFVNIGRADKLGSGVRNLYKYTKIYSGGEPELIEGDVFKTILPLKEIGSIGANGDPIGEVIGEAIGEPRFPDHFPKTETQDDILVALSENPTLSVSALAMKVGVSDRSIKQNIKVLRESGLLERVGSNRKGQLVVKVRNTVL